ncbi:hypothetical protein [Arsenicibacter rosenii]|uniref:hypothetical protein n=1 Tax=Arsenicibacter rosenii TaxID=1750698 RepID=UPI0011605F75|nr:hypothetical protein [Arsenicibacter rosenii]
MSGYEDTTILPYLPALHAPEHQLFFDQRQKKPTNGSPALVVYSGGWSSKVAACLPGGLVCVRNHSGMHAP